MNYQFLSLNNKLDFITNQFSENLQPFLQTMISSQSDKLQGLLPRGIQKKCLICSKQFGFLTKQHQCKRCLRAICSECGTGKIMLFKKGFEKKAHRTCSICKKQMKEMKEYIDSNNLVFGSMSDIGLTWTKKVPNNFNKNRQPGELKLFPKQIFNEMWDSYNYTMRQFIGLMTFELNQAVVYKLVNEVFLIVINGAPQRQIKQIALMAIFFLCFCSPQKSALLSLHLINLHFSVIDQQKFIQAYLKALSISDDLIKQMKNYIEYQTKRYIKNYSINATNVKSSIYIIDRILRRKKIEQIYIFFCLSLEQNKKAIILFENNLPYLDLLFVRNSSIQIATMKYKQASLVKSSLFLRQLAQFSDINNENTNEDKKDEQDYSYKEQKRQPQIKKLQKYFSKVEETLQKQYDKAISEKQFNQGGKNEDSFEMINLIEEMKQNNKMRQFEYSQGSYNIKRLNRESPTNFLFTRDIDKSKDQISQFKRKMIASQEQQISSFDKGSPKMCKECKKKEYQISSLKQKNIDLENDIDKLKKIEVQFYKIKPLIQNSKLEDKQQNFVIKSENDYQLQIKKLGDKIQKYQNAQKQNSKKQSVKRQRDQQKIKLQSSQIQNWKKKFDESRITIEMLQNRLQNYTFGSTGISKQLEHDVSEINNRLKLSLKQKNEKIEELLKQNKLLAYQIDEINKSAKEQAEKKVLIKKIEELNKQKQQFACKIKDLYNLLMKQQDQKLRLSQQNFGLRQILKQNRINFSHLLY